MVRPGRSASGAPSCARAIRPRSPTPPTELEALGFDTIWVPGRGPTDLEQSLRVLLDATERMTIATGIVSIWTHPPRQRPRSTRGSPPTSPARSLLGVGVSHAPNVEREEPYRRPLTAMTGYLDALDAAETPVPSEDRIIAALAPKMLALSRDRSLGSHPYLVTPAHTRLARELLGPDALLAPEQTVVVETDPDRARATARTLARRPTCVFRTTSGTCCASDSTRPTSSTTAATGS